MRPRRCLALCLLAGTSLPAAAGAQSWELIGPPGGPVTALGADPTAPATLYAASHDAGLFRSDDGGARWRLLPASAGISGGIGQVVRFGAGGAIYVRYSTGRLQRSLDRGASWAEAGVPGDEPGEYGTGPVAADPATPGLLWAGGGFGPYRSTDGGDRWTRLDGFPAPSDPAGGPLGITGLAVSPQLPGTLWAATTREGVFRSGDGGDTWAPASGGLAGSALEVRGLVAVPGASQTVLAWTVGGVYRSADGGVSWQPSGAGLPSVPREVVADPLTPNRLWARAGALYRSTDGGASWSGVGGGLPAPVDAVTAGARGVVAGGPAGAFLSRDGGASWQPSNAGIHGRTVTEVDADPGGGSILATSPDGTIRRSDDGGETWRLTYDTADRPIYLARSPQDPRTVYAGDSLTVLRSGDGGDTWEPRGPVPPPDRQQFIGRVWAHPDDPGTAYASASWHVFLGGDSVHLFRTTDGGESWDDLWGGFPRAVMALAVHPLDPDLVVAGTNADLRRSADGGQSWQGGASGLPELPWIVDLAADPAIPGRFLAWVLGHGLYVTADAGATWSAAGTGLPPTTFAALLFDPERPGAVYAAVAPAGGVYGSADGGATWQPLGGGLTGERLGTSVDLALGGSAPRRLYAATINGVARRPLASAPCTPDTTTLCFHDGRFAARVAWDDPRTGSGVGRSHPLTGDTGGFWFFRESNLELFVKVLDGRPVNGRWWVFYGSLSNVGFTLSVTDTETGTPRVYENPPRTMASRGDTAAF